MEIIKDKEFGGERPLFASQGIKLENVTVHAGESALKCCRNIVASHCRFEGKYPFWHVKGFEISGVDIAERAPWRKKQMIMVETAAKEPKNGKRFKRRWFANERIGNNIYEWDDINIDLISGDTIIDLGNTLLPKEDNIIIIRKGFGRTRILVPLGVAILLEHSTFYGTVRFEEEKYQLKNESLKIYSNDYDTNLRRLKIMTNTLVGDVEVIRV